MRKYVEFAKIFFKAQIIYRFDVAITITEVVGRVLFAWLIWGAIFANRDMVGGFTFQAMLLYYVISSFIATLEIGNGGEVSATIRGGHFSKFMVIPINPQLYWISQNFGVILYLAIFVLPAAVFCAIIFGAGVYVGQPAAILLGISMIPIGLTFMITYHVFIGLLAFKIQDVWVIEMVQSELIRFTQGGIVPLILLPEVAFAVIRLLPFPHIIFTPTMLIMGKISFAEGLFSFGLLSLWLAIITLVTQLSYQHLRVKYDGVGI